MLRLLINHFFVLLVALASSTGLALVGSNNFLPRSMELNLLQFDDKLQIHISPFSKNYRKNIDSQKLNLFLNRSSVDDVVSYYKNKNFPYYITLRKKPKNNRAGLSDFGMNFESYDFYIGENRLCQGELAAFIFQDGRHSVKSTTQRIKNLHAPAFDWSNPPEIVENLPSNQLVSTCIFNYLGNLVEAWEVNSQIDQSPYRAYYSKSGEIYEFKKQSVDAIGTIKTFGKNPIEDQGQLFNYTLEVDDAEEGARTLNNVFFTTNPVGVERVQNDDYEYIYDLETKKLQLEEATVFAHANDHLQYFVDNGYRWVGPRPMTLQVHEIFKDGKNNGVYLPAGTNGVETPTIKLGDGDGIILGDLALDRDVVAHELGHHFLYRTLFDIDSSIETLILHEGYADFLALDAVNNSCLAESICRQPESYQESGLICWIGDSSPLYDTRCLRSAETALTLDSAEDANLPYHLQSQVISGMLWDLRRPEDDTRVQGINGYGIDVNTLREISHRAVDFFVSNSGYTDMIVSLLEADYMVTEGANASKIYLAAQARGYGKYLQDIDCDTVDCDFDTLPEIVGLSKEISIDQPAEKHESGCGTFSEAAVGQFNLIPLLIFFVPLMIVAIKKEDI